MIKKQLAKLILLAIVGLIILLTISSLLMAVWTLYQPLWQVLDLIIIPLVLVAGGYLLNQTQRKREVERSRKEREQEDERAKRERETDRQIAQDRDEEAALQKYLDKMAELLINKELLKSEEDLGTQTEHQPLAFTSLPTKIAHGRHSSPSSPCSCAQLAQLCTSAGCVRADGSTVLASCVYFSAAATGSSKVI